MELRVVTKERMPFSSISIPTRLVKDIEKIVNQDSLHPRSLPREAGEIQRGAGGSKEISSGSLGSFSFMASSVEVLKLSPHKHPRLASRKQWVGSSRTPQCHTRILLVTAFPPDRGRLSEYAAALVREITRLYPLHLEILTDSISPSTESTTIVSVWRPDSILSIIKLWIRVILASERVVHFNLHMAVFGRGRLVNFLGLLTPLIARAAQKKVMVTLHNVPAMIKLSATGLPNTPANHLGLWLAARLVAAGSNVLVVTMRSYVRLVKQMYGARNAVWMPHGAWFTEAEPAWRWGGNGNILFLGYIGPYKDLEILAQAVGLLARKRGKSLLLISGSPHPNFQREGAETLRRLGSVPYVRLLGLVPDERLPALVSNVDLAVLPYKTSTGTSGVLHLLSGLGVPLLVSDTPEFRELSSEGASMMLTGLEPGEMASKIEHLMLDRELAEGLSKKSIEFARSRPWSSVARKYVELYSVLLAR